MIVKDVTGFLEAYKMKYQLLKKICFSHSNKYLSKYFHFYYNYHVLLRNIDSSNTQNYSSIYVLIHLILTSISGDKPQEVVAEAAAARQEGQSDVH